MGLHFAKVASFEVKMGRGFGNTLLHVTTDGLVLASSHKGVIFDLVWDQIYTATPQKHRLMLTWKSTTSTILTYSMNFEDPNQVIHAIRKANCEFALGMTFLDSMRHDHAKEINLIASKTRTDFDNNKDGWHATEIPERVESIIASTITPVIASRDTRISRSIQDKHVWNDAWYDSSKGYFVTHNIMFKQIDAFYRRAEQIKHESILSDGSVSLEGFIVKFMFGYPAMVLSWDGDGGHADAWTLIPTIRPEMLTVEMTNAKTQTSPSDHALTYSTDPPGVYVSEFHSPISVHEAVIYDDGMRKHATSMYRGIIAQLNYLHENIHLPDGVDASASGSKQQHDVFAAHDDPIFLKLVHKARGHDL